MSVSLPKERRYPALARILTNEVGNGLSAEGLDAHVYFGVTRLMRLDQLSNLLDRHGRADDHAHDRASACLSMRASWNSKSRRACARAASNLVSCACRPSGESAGNSTSTHSVMRTPPEYFSVNSSPGTGFSQCGLRNSASFTGVSICIRWREISPTKLQVQ